MTAPAAEGRVYYRGTVPGDALDKAIAVARQAEHEGYAAVDFVSDFAGAMVLDESAVMRGV